MEPLVAGALPLLVALHGPTASGKTGLAVELAERFGGEVVSCDSVAVYRELEIGTAKPTAEERARVPHHMLDVVAPDQPYTAGDYSRDARVVLGGIMERGRMPIVAGGTGLYLRALIDGLFPEPERSAALRERLRAIESRRRGTLARMLLRVDPVSAARIHEHDLTKIIRALEVTFLGRQPMSMAWRAGREPLRGFRILRLGLDPPRVALYERIDQRAAEMFARGLVEETEGLLARYGRECRTLESLGYKQAAALLAGECSREEAIARTQQGHRNYAKRQRTWFKQEKGSIWLEGFGDATSIREKAIECVQAHL